MARLLLMRHAKSSWSDPRVADHERPLNGRGQRTAPRMGRWMLDQDLAPDVILTSTAIRAAATAEAIANVIGEGLAPVAIPRLYHASTDTIIDVLASAGQSQECIMLVAHNPGIEDFLLQTTGRLEFCPTAVLAVIDFPGEWSDLYVKPSGICRHLWRPKELPEEEDF